MYTIEKPVDTFIVLFVIFIVAFVLIQILAPSGQDQVSKVKEIQYQANLQEELADAKGFCHDQCAVVINEGCSPRAMAEYCITTYGEAIDFNQNGKTDYDDTYFNGLGICEDTVYCPQLVDCYCQEKLSLPFCTQILCDYYKEEQALDADSASVLVGKVMDLGTCNAAKTNWVTVLKESGAFSCSVE